jgi:PleD family two-component response regulator
VSTGLQVRAATPDRVLIADDSGVNRALLRGILTRQGFEVAEVADGDSALAAALEAPPELILLDIDMPRRDGFEVCAELKRHAQTAEVPIIFLSSFDQSEQKIRGLELGAAD